MARSFAIGVAAFALIVALGAQAQTATWNQTGATAAAAEFETAVSGLRDGLRQAVGRSISPDKSRMYRVMQDLRQIEWLAQSLHADLVSGAGLEETTPIYNQIQENRVYAKNDAMYMDITAPLKPKLEASRAALAKLEVFYPAKPAP